MELGIQSLFTAPSTAASSCCPSRCIDAFVDTLYRSFTNGLDDGPPTVSQAASAMGVSVRTLQRHLRKHDLSYTKLVDEVRLAVAVDRLSNTSIKMIEIAFDLGYSDPAHFTRAFRRWLGVSPREYRSLRVA